MRRRLVLTLVALVAGALLVAGVGEALLTGASVRRQATSDLVDQARTLATGAASLRRPAVLGTVRRVLRLEDASVVVINALGQPRTALPAGLTTGSLDPAQLRAGRTVSGVDGGVAFAAAPFTPSAAERIDLRIGALAVPVIVLTRQVGALGPDWTYIVGAGAVALLVAALVAWRLGARISRPLEQTADVTRRIAHGDLDARVPTPPGELPELASLAGSVNAMAGSLARARENERALLLSVSHDLRTPLTSIRGYAEAITDGASADPAGSAAVIVAESRRLERLVSDLVDLGRLRMQRLPITPAVVDAAAVLAHAVDLVRPLADQGGLTIELSATPGWLVVADADRLAQVLVNLLENAASFARAGIVATVGPATLHADPGPAGDGGTGSAPAPAGPAPAVALCVEDDGPGIPAGEHTLVFERFHQVDQQPGRRLGSGVGLAVVAELTAAMRGTVTVTSPTRADAGGTRMTVVLPAPAARWPVAPGGPPRAG